MSQPGKVSKKFRDNRKWPTSGKRSERSLRKSYLVVTEGEETEPIYLKLIGENLPKGVLIVPKGTGYNTMSLVERAIKEKARWERSNPNLDEVWVLMDKDSFPNDNFDNAISKCEAHTFLVEKKKKTFHCGWSNESFELWLLLHLKDQFAWIGREEINKSISKEMGKKYSKVDKTLMREILKKGSEHDAIRRAKRLFEKIDTPPSGANPATKVYQLIEEIREIT